MATVQLVGAVGRTEHDLVAGEARDQVRDRVAGRRVRPVEVLDDDQDGAVGGEPAEEANGGVEQAGLAADASSHVSSAARAPSEWMAPAMPGTGCQRGDGSGIEGGDRLSIVLVEVIPQGSDDRAKGRPIPPIETHAPRRIRKPRSSACWASSFVNRVFPTPASPAIRM